MIDKELSREYAERRSETAFAEECGGWLATLRLALFERLALARSQGQSPFMHTKTISISGTCLVPIDPALLKQCPLGEEVDVSAERDALVIRPVRRKARQGWAESLAALPAGVVERDTVELAAFRETPHDWDRQEWEW